MFLSSCEHGRLVHGLVRTIDGEFNAGDERSSAGARLRGIYCCAGWVRGVLCRNRLESRQEQGEGSGQGHV